jgi:hypothetical protein
MTTVFRNILLRSCALVGCAALVFGSTRCSNDFDVTANYKEIPVVYALLNQHDTAHYVRIEKAFLDKTTAAAVLAKDPNSLYFSSLDVKLQGYNGSNSPVGTAINLSRVDGNLEGYAKAGGTFTSQPNWLYKTKATLNPALTYRLTIVSADTHETYTAETKLIQDYAFIDSPQEGNPLSCVGKSQIPFEWQLPTNAAVCDIVGIIEFTEHPVGAPTQLDTVRLEWTLARNVTPDANDRIKFKLEGDAFFRFMLEKIPVKANFTRCGNSLRFAVNIYSGAEAYSQYATAISDGTSVATTDVVAKYSNITNGRGVFSARHKFVSGSKYLFVKSTIDSLADGYRTRKLNFTPSLTPCN